MHQKLWPFKCMMLKTLNSNFLHWPRKLNLHINYNLFILVMCIPFLRISSPRDFVKCISGKMNLWRKKLIVREFLLPGKIKKMLSPQTCVYWSKELGIHMTKVNRLYTMYIYSPSQSFFARHERTGQRSLVLALTRTDVDFEWKQEYDSLCLNLG